MISFVPSIFVHSFLQTIKRNHWNGGCVFSVEEWETTSWHWAASHLVSICRSCSVTRLQMWLHLRCRALFPSAHSLVKALFLLQILEQQIAPVNLWPLLFSFFFLFLNVGCHWLPSARPEVLLMFKCDLRSARMGYNYTKADRYGQIRSQRQVNLDPMGCWTHSVQGNQ